MTPAQMVAALQRALAVLGLLRKQQSAPTPTPTAKPPIMPQVQRNYIDLMIGAITDYEGGPGDLNHRNNNPGNIRSWPTQIGTNGGFAVFKTWNDGVNALRTLLTNAATGRSANYHPTMSLLQFFETYAPGADNNDPLMYAKFVAKRMGVDITWKISNLV